MGGAGTLGIAGDGARAASGRRAPAEAARVGRVALATFGSTGGFTEGRRPRAAEGLGVEDLRRMTVFVLYFSGESSE